MTMSGPSDLDPNAVRRQFARRVQRLERADFLLRDVERRMLDRLEVVRLQPAAILDIGTGLGQGAVRLQQRYPQARVLGVDLVPGLAARAAALHGAPARSGLAARLRGWFGGVGGEARAPVFAAADAGCLPVAGSSVALIWSNLAWHWFPDPFAVLTEWHRAIRPEGLLCFSTFGVDTLRELRPLGVHLPAFPDMHDIGDALVRAGFVEPVMDTERISVTWQSAAVLLDELSALGGDALRDRRRGLAGRARREAWLGALERLRNAEGVIPLTFELVFAHAWAPSRKRRDDGYAPIRFDLDAPGSPRKARG
jgi:malonyl-CoA O-methyltransferase